MRRIRTCCNTVHETRSFTSCNLSGVWSLGKPIYIYMYTYSMYMSTYIHKYIYPFIHIYIYTHVHIHIYIKTYIHIYTYTYIHIWARSPDPHTTPLPPQWYPPPLLTPPPPQNLVFACFLHMYIHIYTYILPFPPLQPRISTLFAALESHDLVNGPCLPVYFYHNLFVEPPIACLAHGLQHICYLWITQSLPMQT